ncbi:hypothetical protein E2C01_052854 [Portunus trituberculatus]|uniref:Uncharacterized protein n=1 Tax=Portunus trituberculatus TaxID=210409 RepID=A0A5B7GQG6_PORTR|nr:hypothetical protein [Portunus trituberculatus]
MGGRIGRWEGLDNTAIIVWEYCTEIRRCSWEGRQAEGRWNIRKYVNTSSLPPRGLLSAVV